MRNQMREDAAIGPDDSRRYYYLGLYRRIAYAQKLGSSLERCLKWCIIRSRVRVVHRLIHRKWGSTIRVPRSGFVEHPENDFVRVWTGWWGLHRSGNGQEKKGGRSTHLPRV